METHLELQSVTCRMGSHLPPTQTRPALTLAKLTGARI